MAKFVKVHVCLDPLVINEIVEANTIGDLIKATLIPVGYFICRDGLPVTSKSTNLKDYDCIFAAPSISGGPYLLDK